MKAVILVGGSGTRLRPLTCSRPKQLLPLTTTTLIGYLLEQLSHSDITEAILATGNGIDQLKDALGDGSLFGLTLHYSYESKPLGTAGAIKNTESLLQDETDFLALNGDIISDIQYNQLIHFHRQHHATTTIALHQVEDPSRFGVVEISAEGRIHNFIEKPSPDTAPSNLINAGCYVLSQTVLDAIPASTEVSIEREIFPRLCRSSRVYGWEHHGAWVDTGTPVSFLKAHRILNEKQGKTMSIDSDAKINPSAKIGANVTIGKRAVIGPNAHIQNAVLFDEVIVGENVTIDHAIIGQGVVIGRGITLQDYTIIGDGAIIDAGAEIFPGAMICPQCHIKKGEIPPQCLV
ncbi:MAG: sugar phosphate nucleotidyltransferase, partial [Candidatus Thorarchaeota archaeon]